VPDVQYVVIIEDDPLALKLYRDLVRSRGYGVFTAGDGHTGIQLVREHQPDLVITDINLPELTGVEVCAALKADERTRDIPIL
jgi:CheY-like chemotaxis protein